MEAERIIAIIDFITASRPGWASRERQIMLEYVTWHLANGSCLDIWDRGKLVAVGIAWPCQPGDWQFAWKPWDASAPWFYIDELVCDPGMLTPFLRAFQARYPQHINWDIVGLREGELVNFGPAPRCLRLLKIMCGRRCPSMGWIDFVDCARRIVQQVKDRYPCCEHAMCGGVSVPAERDMYEEGSGTLKAQTELAPDVYASEARFRPLYAKLELDQIRTSLLGDDGHEGLLSMLENDVAPASARINAAAQSGQREADINDVLRLSPASMKAMREIDPERTALLDLLTKQATDEVALGTQLDPSMQRSVQQAVRSGQADRGFGFGPSDMFEEVLASSDYGQQMRDKRRAYAANVLNQRNQIYGDPFLQILGRPAASNPQSYVSQGQQIGGTTPKMFDPFTQYASDLYSQNYDAKLQASIASANNQAGLISGAMSAVGGMAGSI